VQNKRVHYHARSRTFRRRRFGATVSALTVSALGLLGAGTFRHRPAVMAPDVSALVLYAEAAVAATLHSDTNNTSG